MWPINVKIKDGHMVQSLGVGCIHVVKPGEIEGVLLDVDYVPTLQQNLFSSGIMAGKSFKITAQYNY